ncbi:MAG: urea ABC transporter ATP-binding subunit UrtE [Candidatus Epulonipiscioides saccharophilum]|nr:MAG: urea ABC transporter ATP-binding subunit UrtE [Epulopiscium sp. AS2M-Bin001]
MITINNLYTYYAESMILEKLSLNIPKGKITALVGRNGVGKSTTLKSILGLTKTPSGNIIFNGEDITNLPTYSRVKKGIGYVPQGREIFGQMTVLENLELGLQPLGGRGSIPDYLYELFPILHDFSKRKAGDLSGGQQQQLAIARALVADPKILILDEPTEGIQPSIIEDIGSAIKKVNSWKNITVLLVEQYLDFVLENSDIIYVMERGEIIFSGSPDETEYIQFLMTH